MQYYLRLADGRDLGPLTEASVFGCIRAGRVNQDSWLWNGTQWEQLKETLFAHEIPTVRSLTHPVVA